MLPPPTYRHHDDGHPAGRTPRPTPAWPIEAGRATMTAMTSSSRVIRASRGTELSALGWQTEAPLRMLMNNLDPEVAEHPEDLVVYGGTGKAARDHESLKAIVRCLLELD